MPAKGPRPHIDKEKDEHNPRACHAQHGKQPVRQVRQIIEYRRHYIPQESDGGGNQRRKARKRRLPERARRADLGRLSTPAEPSTPTEAAVIIGRALNLCIEGTAQRTPGGNQLITVGCDAADKGERTYGRPSMGHTGRRNEAGTLLGSGHVCRTDVGGRGASGGSADRRWGWG